MAYLLKIDGIGKSFGKKTVLDNVSVEIKEKDIVAVVGISGCGKSTLLKILVGYIDADCGKILLDDKNVSKNVRQLRRICGYTTQENSFYEMLSVIENMQYYAGLYGVPLKISEQRIKNILMQVGLYESRFILAGNISGGMKRRLDFAISLIHDPDILILDEPTVGLDPLNVDLFWKIVREIVAKEKKIVIVTSHVFGEIEKYCNRVAVMHKGKIVTVFEKDEIPDLEKKFRKIVGGAAE